MSEPWPEGVIARYLTVGGAAVDLAIKQVPHLHPDGISGTRGLTLAACTGCPASTDFSHGRVHHGSYSDWEVHDPQAADVEARAWAQSHAETCRAMPRPSA